MADSIEVFHDSLTRCLGQPRFLELFYERFLASSDDVRVRFENTDFEKQRRMLKASFYLIMLAAQGDPGGIKHLDEIAEQHSARGLDIQPQLYRLWLECLIDTVAKCDSSYGPAIERAWREMMTPGIVLMTKRYDQSAGRNHGDG